tara:strand:- start:84161 stop:84991 length:831 start_codon:yes stop_codon:yes gene_type:complete
MSTPFTLKNSHNLDLLGDTHIPAATPSACVIVLHGLKGYKDYGFIPILSHDLCDAGMLVHRFNTSTSGMTNETDRFAREDLFSLDTWNRQVEDIVRVVQAITNGELKGNGLPIFIIGHSRGGASALLAAGRHRRELNLAGVITINSVDRCLRMSETDQSQLLDRGYIVTPSARTKQDLRINSTWLSEQLDDPDGHDVLLQASKITCPVCVIHGEQDQAVDLSAGRAIAKACKTDAIFLDSGNHVLNMPNPSRIDMDRSPQLVETTTSITRFIAKYT